MYANYFTWRRKIKFHEYSIRLSRKKNAFICDSQLIFKSHFVPPFCQFERIIAFNHKLRIMLLEKTEKFERKYFFSFTYFIIISNSYLIPRTEILYTWMLTLVPSLVHMSQNRFTHFWIYSNFDTLASLWRWI